MGDYKLLHQLILKGLPLERPAQLMAQMGENSLYTMTGRKHHDFQSRHKPLGEAGKAVVGFTQQMDFNPICTFTEILDIEPSNGIFDFGVKCIDTETKYSI